MINFTRLFKPLRLEKLSTSLFHYSLITIVQINKLVCCIFELHVALYYATSKFCKQQLLDKFKAYFCKVYVIFSKV